MQDKGKWKKHSQEELKPECITITDQQAVLELANQVKAIANDLGVELYGSQAMGQFIAQNPTAFRQEIAESDENSSPELLGYYINGLSNKVFERAIIDLGITLESKGPKGRAFLSLLEKGAAFTSFKEIVDWLNNKGFDIEYSDRYKKVDESLSESEFQDLMKELKSSRGGNTNNRKEDGKKNIENLGFEDGKTYDYAEVLEKIEITGAAKIIWKIIEPIVKKLGLKIKFDSSALGYGGFFNPNTGEIVISGIGVQKDYVGEVFVHELTHAVTTKIISDVSSGKTDGLSQKQIDAVKGLLKLYEETKKLGSYDDYHFKNVFEFVAHLSNEQHKRELEKHEKKFLERFVDFVLDILGINNSYDLAKHYLKDIIDDGSYLVNNGITTLADTLHARKRNLSNKDLTNRQIEDIQEYIESLPKNLKIDGPLFLIKGNNLYKFNVSLKQYDKNRADRHDGFEILSHWSLSGLNSSIIKELKDVIRTGQNVGFFIDKQRGEYEVGDGFGSTIGFGDQRTTTGNDRLAAGALQGKSNRGPSGQQDSGNILPGFGVTEQGQQQLKEPVAKPSNENGNPLSKNDDIQATHDSNSNADPEITTQVVQHLEKVMDKAGKRVYDISDKTEQEVLDPDNQLHSPRPSVNREIDRAKKEELRGFLRKINRTGRTLLEDGDGTMYLLDHADKEGIDNRDPKKHDGFNCVLKFSVAGLSREDINNIKEAIENGIIRDQASFDKWAKSNIGRLRNNNSDSIDATDRQSDADNDRLDLQASERESIGGQSTENSQTNRGTGFIKVRDNDGTNGHRYIPINQGKDVSYHFKTSRGEVYGFLDADGNIGLDYNIITAEHPIHEYTHLWDKVVQSRNPELWNRGVELMKQIPLWEEITNSSEYGQMWRSQGKADAELDNLIASEVHARLVGRNGGTILNDLAKQKGSKNIIGKLRQWLLDVWKNLAETFGAISKERLNNMTLEEFNMMTLRDFSNETDLAADTPTKNSESTVVIKPQYRGKLIYAQAGTGKSTIADNKTIYDSDYILGELLGVSTETAGFFFKTLSLKQKKAFGEQYRVAIRQKIAEGKTVITANASLLEEADVVVYNESADLTEERVNAPNRAKTNRYSDKQYHQKTLDKINKLQKDENAKNSKEYHSLSSGQYLSSILLDSVGDNSFNSRRETQTSPTRLTQDELISKFLEEFDITVNTIENYEGDIPLFDALNRVINVKNPSEITDGVGYAIAFMMQSDPEMIKIFMNSLGLPKVHPLTKWATAARGSGDTNIPIVKPLLKGIQNQGQKIIKQVGSQIAEELRNYFDNAINEDSTEYTPANKNIWTIIKNFFSKLYNKIKLYNVAKQKELFVSDIIEALGRADFSRIKGPLVKQGSTEKAQIVDIETALRENPFEDSIIRKLGEKGIALAGSASIALEGTLFRPSENPLHDIDFNAGNNSSKESLDKLLPTIFEEGTIRYSHKITKKKGEGCVSYIHLDVPFTTKPKRVKIDGRRVKIVELYGLDGKYLGYKQHYDLYLEAGIQGKMLDFFVGKNKESEHGFYKKTMNGHEYLLSHAAAAIAAKILWARPKDMWDYKLFEPNGFQELDSVSNRGTYSLTSDDANETDLAAGSPTQEFRTSQGELYGFVDSKGNIYVDEHKIKPEHLMHEYVHLWDRAVMKHNPALWKRGVALMKRTALRGR